MPVTLAVACVAAIAAVVVGVTALRNADAAPLDVTDERRWLVRWLTERPRVGRFARALDTRVAGGLLLVAALAVVFAAATIVGLTFDMVDRGSGLARWDRSVAEWGSENATPTTTDVLAIVTRLGGTPYLAGIAVILAIVDLIRFRNMHVPLFLLAVLAGVGTVNTTLKVVVGRDRPDVEHLVSATGAAFPSGHSSAAAAGWCAFALVLSRSWPKPGRALAAAAAALVAVAVAASRALLGVHWLTDVVAGLVVGWGWFLFCALVFGGRLQRLGEPLEQADEQTERRDDEVVTPACGDGVGHRAAADDEGRRARS